MARRKVFHGQPAQIKITVPTKLRLEEVGSRISVKRGYKLAPAEVVDLAVDALEQQLASGVETVAPK